MKVKDNLAANFDDVFIDIESYLKNHYYHAPPKNVVSAAGEFWEVLARLPHPEGGDSQALKAEEDDVRHLGHSAADGGGEHSLQDK